MWSRIAPGALVAVAACGRIGFEARTVDGDGSVIGDGTTGTGDGTGGNTDGPPSTDANFMFVTSTQQAPAAFGGLAGGDAVCQARASAAGLPGTYVAYLSTSTVNARDRIASARGWIRTDGNAFADDVASLFSGVVFYPPAVDENGVLIGATAVVATGSNASGNLGDANCGNWTVASGTRVGRPYSGATTWTNFIVSGCAASHLYCFGTDRTTPVAPPAPAGRRAFVAPGFTPAGGLAGADAHCASAASAAGQSGTFRALLATAAATAASRFTVGAWYRLDGVRFTQNLVALDAPLRVTAARSYVTTSVWTGAADPFTVGTSATTCGTWTATGGNGITGESSYAAATSFESGNQQACSLALALYCLEP
ncbi:MAG: hypothetical protein M3680_29175 [Myxococcota bacterium]|nr:hypothetical protein [Myxococcota bacterium]